MSKLVSVMGRILSALDGFWGGILLILAANIGIFLLGLASIETDGRIWNLFLILAVFIQYRKAEEARGRAVYLERFINDSELRYDLHSALSRPSEEELQRMRARRIAADPILAARSWSERSVRESGKG